MISFLLVISLQKSSLVLSHRIKTTEKLIALTFDDGPSPTTTPIVLDALKKAGAKATFFVVGKNAKAFPKLVAREISEGHQIGNHSYTHPKSTSSAVARQEILNTDQAIKAAGWPEKTMFRPPYGIMKGNLAREGKTLGKTLVLWSATAADTATKDPEIVFKNVCFTPNPGEIILLHDVKPHTAKALPRILNHLQQKGFRFVTVAELLKHKKAGSP